MDSMDRIPTLPRDPSYCHNFSPCRARSCPALWCHLYLLCCSRSLSLGLAGEQPLEIFWEALHTRYRLQINEGKTIRQQRAHRRSGDDQAQRIPGIDEAMGDLRSRYRGKRVETRTTRRNWSLGSACTAIFCDHSLPALGGSETGSCHQAG
jgi:hypothetical protein